MPDDDEFDLEDDDPDLCDFCKIKNARWFDPDTETDWCGECDRSLPHGPQPSAN